MAVRDEQGPWWCSLFGGVGLETSSSMDQFLFLFFNVSRVDII